MKSIQKDLAPSILWLCLMKTIYTTTVYREILIKRQGFTSKILMYVYSILIRNSKSIFISSASLSFLNRSESNSIQRYCVVSITVANAPLISIPPGNM